MSEQKKIAVGIDLGTTHSVIAYVDSDGRPTTIRNSEGDTTTPSVVLFEEDGAVVGKEAARSAAYEPELIAEHTKRDIGSMFYEKKICGQQLPPEVVEAIILRKLKQDAELLLGDVYDVVITVPAYFNEPRRKATQDAGQLAGLNVLDIINEPTAAAIAYGVRHQFGASSEKETVLVYDLGGGTFDVTLMEMEANQYTAIATAGDVYLGGIDWDARISDYVAEQFIEHFDVDPREDESAYQRLRQEAEVAKMALTARSSYMIRYEHEGNRLKIDMPREAFEDLTGDLLERTLFTVRKVLKESSRTWSDVTRVLLVGGSTRMPMIGHALEAESGLKVDRSISPDEAVGHGAAVYADLLLSTGDSDREKFRVKNVNSHDLGVLAVEKGTGLPRRKVLIPRNSSLPAMGAGRFATRDEDQQTVVVNVIEGGDASGRNATAIGSCVVSDLPPGLPAKTPVEVRFHYLTNGRLKVDAWLPKTDSKASLEIERASGLSLEKIKYWQQWIASGAMLEPGATDDEKAHQEEDAASEALEDPQSGNFEESDQVEEQPQAEEDSDLGDFLRGLK